MAEAKEDLIGTVEELIENKELNQKFRAQYEDASDERVHQAQKDDSPENLVLRYLSGSQPNAIKYLNYVEAAILLKEKPELRDDYLEEFLDNVDQKFKKSEENSDEILLDKIRAHYSTKLIETDAFKDFKFED